MEIKQDGVTVLRNTPSFAVPNCWSEKNMLLGGRVALRLEDPDTGKTIEALCPPDEFEPFPEPPPTLDHRAFTPLGHWHMLHDALRIQTPPEGRYAAFVYGADLS